MPQASYVYDGKRIRLARCEDETEAEHLLRQAEMDCETALRAREIMLMRGLQRREQARASLQAAAAAADDLAEPERIWAEARLRRMAATLEWSEPRK